MYPIRLFSSSAYWPRAVRRLTPPVSPNPVSLHSPYDINVRRFKGILSTARIISRMHIRFGVNHL